MAAAAAGTRVGTGYVDIEPELARDFHETIARKLNEKLTPALKKVGKRTGKEFGSEVAKEADRDLGKSFSPAVIKRFEKFGREASAAVRKGWGADGRQNSLAIGGLDAMSEFFARTKRDAQRSLPAIERVRARLREMRGDFKRTDFKGLGSEIRQLASTHLKGLGGELRRVGSEFRKTDKRARVTSSGFGGFDGAMARVNRGAQFFRNILRTIKWPVLIAGLGLSLQGLSALAAGAIAAASALGSLSGAMIALPAAALAGAQAFGALKLATSGVGDAVKAALDAEVQGGGQAVDMMRQQREGAERVADAKRNLTDVQEQARSAQDDLTDARESATRQLQDMRRASEETGLSEKEAALSLKEARRELARTLRDPESSGLDVQGAELAVQRARNELENTRVEARRVRKDYREAEKGGVKQMPEVVAAEEAKEDAKRAVTDAERDLRRATEDATEAMKEQGAAASAFNDKMSQLPPAGQKFVRFLVSLKPRLDALRATSAEGFLPGAEDGLKGAMKNFGVVRRLVDGTSSALGRLAKKGGQKLGSAVWGRDLDRLGKLNTRIIDRMGDSTLNLSDALRHALVSGEPFLDWLSLGTEEFSEWVSTEAEAGRETGRLSAFFDRTRATMERLWPILKGVGGGILNVSDVADDLGNDILVSLGDAAEGWRKWTDSTKGRNRLKSYFAETKPAVFEMGRLIRDATKAFFELGRQNGVAHLLRLVRTELIPAMTDLVGATTGWASGFLGEFGALRDQGVPVFDAFVRVLAEHAGEAGITIAKALFDGFVNASIWGKLAIGGFLLTKFGGKGALLAAGGAVGKWLGLGIASGAATTAAGGAAAGAGSAAAGGVAGGLMSRLKGLKWGRLGAAGIGIALADQVMGSFSRRSQEKSSNLLDAFKGIEDSTGIFDAGLFESRSDLERRAGMASNLKAQFQELLRNRGMISASTERSLQDQARELDLTKQQRAQVSRIFEIVRSGRQLGTKVDLGVDPKGVRKITQDFSFLRRGIGTNLKDINRVSARAGRLIVQTFGRGTTETRELTARNMRLTAAAIAQQMTRSGNVTKDGMDRIQRIIRNADLLNPTRKQAGDFGREWAKGMDRTKEVTTKGINRMIAEARKMPGPMRQVALETWLDQAKQAQRSGKLSVEAFQRMRSRIFSEFGTFKASGKAFNREFAQGFVDMANESGGAIGILMDNVKNALGALGGKADFEFTVKKAAAKGGGEQKKQQGGFIVPGTGSGDTFRTALPSSSFIENREAVKRLPFQAGGLMPVALEPGERVYMPPEVKAFGKRTLEARNAAVPRFQAGGLLRRGFQGGGIVPVPGFPGESMSSAVLGTALNFMRRFKLFLTDAYGPGHASPEHTQYGTAIDVVPGPGGSWDMVGQAVASAVKAGFNPVYYDGTRGSIAESGHGPPSVAGGNAHAHITLLTVAELLGGAGVGGFSGVAGGGIQKLKKQILEGPDGPLKAIGQAAIDKVQQSGQGFLGRRQGASGMQRHGPGGGLEATGNGAELMRKISGQRGWNFADWWELDRRETGHGSDIYNESSGASLRAQFLPMNFGSYGPGSDPSQNPSMGEQIMSMASYIAERYGNPSAALAHHDANNWYQRGGLLGKVVQGFKDGGLVGNINRVFNGATLGGSGDWAGLTQLPDYVIAALAEAAGDWRGNNVPGTTMMKVQKHEGANRPGSKSTDAGYGLWAMTKPYADSIVAKLGGYSEQLNPVKSAAAMAMMYTEAHRQSREALINTWHGAAFNVTGLDEHYSGNFDIRDALGGATFEQALKGEAASANGEAGNASPKPIPDKVPFKNKGGSTGAGGGTIAPAEGEVPTALPSFGALPTTIKGCEKELTQRREELWQQRQALRTAKGKKQGRVAKALEGNIAKLRDRIRKLRRQKFVLAAQNRIGKKGKLPKTEAAVEAARKNYEGLVEYAEQTLALEPEDGPAAASYVKNTETPAWEGAFGALGGWRNAILGGQEAAAVRLVKLQEQIAKIRALKESNPEAFKKQKFRIPSLVKAVSSIRGLFNPGPPPSGSLEESLTEVQGGDKERIRGVLPPTPEPGRFGGLVWDTQLQLRELGLNLKKGSGDEEADTERASLLEELLRQSNQRNLVGETAFKVFRDFEKQYAVRDLPEFHTGGVVPGPANREVVAKLRGQEGVFTPEQMNALGDAGPGSMVLSIDQLIVHEDGSVTARMGDKEVRGIAREVVREETREATALRFR